MCFKKIKEGYRIWKAKYSIHPVTLQVANREIMAGYEAGWRDSLYPFFKPVCAYNFILLMIRFVTEGTKLNHWYFLYGSMGIEMRMVLW